MPCPFSGKREFATLDRSTRLISAAAGLALDDAKLLIGDGNSHSVGVSVGTTFGSLHSISQFDRDELIDGPKYVNPSHFPNTVINSPASQVSIRFGIRGFNTTVSTGFCAGLDAISYASDFIRLGRAEIVLAGGVEELCEETFRGFYPGCLSGADGSLPLCCPFDARKETEPSFPKGRLFSSSKMNSTRWDGAPASSQQLRAAGALSTLQRRIRSITQGKACERQSASP